MCSLKQIRIFVCVYSYAFRWDNDVSSLAYYIYSRDFFDSTVVVFFVCFQMCKSHYSHNTTGGSVHSLYAMALLVGRSSASNVSSAIFRRFIGFMAEGNFRE